MEAKAGQRYSDARPRTEFKTQALDRLPILQMETQQPAEEMVQWMMLDVVMFANNPGRALNRDVRDGSLRGAGSIIGNFIRLRRLFVIVGQHDRLRPLHDDLGLRSRGSGTRLGRFGDDGCRGRRGHWSGRRRARFDGIRFFEILEKLAVGLFRRTGCAGRRRGHMKGQRQNRQEDERKDLLFHGRSEFEKAEKPPRF